MVSLHENIGDDDSCHHEESPKAFSNEEQNDEKSRRESNSRRTILQSEAVEKAQSPLWMKNPSLYLAPSTQGDGWGVFSSRDLSMGDIVELAPLFLRFDDDHAQVLKQSILNNYHYEYWAWNGVSFKAQYVLSFGYMLYFNHSSEPNIFYQQFGREPDMDSPDGCAALGYYALCDIPARTELFCDYGGSTWFKYRGLELVDKGADADSNKEADHEEIIHRHYRRGKDTTPLILNYAKPQVTSNAMPKIHLCSRLYAGYDMKAFRRLMKHHREDFEIPPYNLDSLQPYLISQERCSTGFGNIVTRQAVQVGETLEVSPCLVISKHLVENTLLEAVSLEWEDLYPANEVVDVTVKVVRFDEEEKFKELNVRGKTTNHKGQAQVMQSVHDMPRNDTVLLPLAGCLAMASRDATDYNVCYTVERDCCNDSGFLLRAVSTKPILAGERIVAKLPSLRQTLIDQVFDELALTGQPIGM